MAGLNPVGHRALQYWHGASARLQNVFYHREMVWYEVVRLYGEIGNASREPRFHTRGPDVTYMIGTQPPTQVRLRLIRISAGEA